MPEIITSDQILGVQLVNLQTHADDRGQFVETFRKEWFPQRDWQIVQTNRSESKPSVLRGLHFHFKQVDYWHVIAGRVRVGLADLRQDSPTFRAAYTIDLDASRPQGLFIPVGVAHGFLAQTDATLVYIVDNYYSGADEMGVAWNDPQFDLDWGIGAPLVSRRDQENPRLDEIPAARLPNLRDPTTST